MNVLITGSNGFVGKNILDYFKDFEFVKLSLRYKPFNNIKFSSNVIIHLAGKAHDLKNTAKPNDYYEANYELIKQLYDAFLLSTAKKFIFISSVKADADSLSDILTEDYSPNPQTHYGKSKLMAEQYIQSLPLPKDKQYYILRPCMIYGEGSKGNLNLLYPFVQKKLPYPLAAFDNFRSFLSVENLCFVIREIIEREDIPSGIYNVSDDCPLSTNEVISLMSKSLNIQPKPWKINKDILKFMARVRDVLNLPLNTERLNKLTENFIVSNKKIKNVLKKKLPLASREGILKTALSFRDA